jgi:hypothetical protein
VVIQIALQKNIGSDPSEKDSDTNVITIRYIYIYIIIWGFNDSTFCYIIKHYDFSPAAKGFFSRRGPNQ